MATKIVDEYLNYYTTYSKEYGEKTCILLNVGSFYEMEMVKNEVESIGNLDEVCEILNIQMTKKNKSIETVDRNNPYFAGFPTHSLPKFLPILLDNGYTVVVIDQEEGNQTGRKKRKVSGIYSPSIQPLNLEDKSGGDGNSLLSILLEIYNETITYSVININITTNTVDLYSGGQSCGNVESVLDDIYRMSLRYNVKEMLIRIVNLANSGKIPKQFSKTYMSEYFDVNDTSIQWQFLSKELKESKEFVEYLELNKVDHQNKYLRKIYQHVSFGLLEPVEYFELARNQSDVINLIYTLQFIAKHDEKYVKNIGVPNIVHEYDYLLLEMNTLQQLNVLPSKVTNSRYGSLFSVINKTKTTIGRRGLKKLLSKPFKDIRQIQERYELSDALEAFKESDLPNCDFERLHRKMGLQILHPYEFYNLHNAYERILKLDETLKHSNKECIVKHCLSNETREQLSGFMEEYDNKFELEELKKYNLNETLMSIESFFKHGSVESIDKIKDKIRAIERDVEDLRKEIEGDSGQLKTQYTDQDGYFFTCTKIRFEALKKTLPKKILESINVKNTSNSCKITTATLTKFSNQLVNNRELYAKQIKLHYTDYLQTAFTKYNNIFPLLVQFVETIDISLSNIKCKSLYNYCRPEIVESNQKEQQSFVDCKNLRHPIIERINDSTEYIPNDVVLNDKNTGMILYALNSCGKSSLLRSIGLCLIMAQCGLYVPCSEMKYYPFETIVTQVDLCDNIWKSQSSFITEMIGLRKIVKLANSSTLVLSDELTKGTEVVSATSIFAASVLELLDKDCKFVFTTHLQDVAKLKVIQNAKNLNIMHLSVVIVDDNIKFERKLQPGPCSELYGLEVAKAVGIDKKMLDVSFEIRNELLGRTAYKTKRSKYNTKKILESCEICGYKPIKSTDIPLDTHHIKFQCTADENDKIEHYHKNSKFNLVCVCKNCHIDVHKGNILITGYKQTTNGVELEFTKL